MLQKTKDGFYVLEKLTRIPHLLHAFSTVDFGKMQILRNRARFAKTVGVDPQNLISVRQEQGKKIFIVGPGSSINQSEKITADGLMTNQKNIGLIIKTADCLPILLCDPKKEIIGLIHAGRKGIFLKIHLEAIAKMKQNFRCQPGNIIVGLGPAICPRCYDKIDLRGSVLADFQKMGLKKENIEVANICTFENNNFYSHRRGESSRFATILCLQ